MEWWNYDSRKFFLLGIRIYFGIWFLYGGLFKWISVGPNTFVGFIATQFDKPGHPIC